MAAALCLGGVRPVRRLRDFLALTGEYNELKNKEEKTMPEHTPTSIVKITIEGLAICYFKAPEWKVLFPIHNEHDFESLIITHGRNPRSEIVNLESGCNIVIRSEDARRSDHPPVFEDGDIDRASNQKHPLDWRWIVNLDDIHENEVTLCDGARTARLSLSKCTFYTDAVTACDYHKFRINDNARRSYYGRMGFKAAAKFALTENDASMRVEFPDGGVKPFDFKREDGTWYEIAFRNSRSPFHSHMNSKTDFPLYYDVIETRGEKYDFDPDINAFKSEPPAVCGVVTGGANLFR
jgi:hypothetical protein